MLIAFCPAEMNDGDKISINSKFDSIVESINVGDVNSDFHGGWMTWAAVVAAAAVAACAFCQLYR